MPIIKKDETSAGVHVEQRESLCTLGGIVIGATTMENSMDDPHNL